MKITLKQLKSIIKEEIQRSRKNLKEATGGDGPEVVDADNYHHLEVGNEYKIKGMPGTNQFTNWSSDDVDTNVNDLKLMFTDVEHGDEWEAFYDSHKGVFVWGSSSTPLFVTEASIDPEDYVDNAESETQDDTQYDQEDDMDHATEHGGGHSKRYGDW